MTTLIWIVVGGIAMSALALVGGVTLLLPERTLGRLIMPLVALAAGSLLGGAMFHMVPSAVGHIGNELALYGWLVGGFVVFFLLEQFLHWHHCHRPVSQHRPLGYLILLADGAHNLIGGLSVGAAFLVDIELGIVTWLVAAAHEIPQELGDFGILVHSGWRPRLALYFNLLSGLTFLIGGVLAYALSGALEIVFLVPFAAGNFIYIASADLIPQLTTTQACTGRDELQLATRDKLEQSAALVVGLLTLYLTAGLI